MPPETALHYVKFAASTPNVNKVLEINRYQYHQCNDGGLGYGEFVGMDPSAKPDPTINLTPDTGVESEGKA